MEITCPSGLKGRIRALTAKDGRFLTNQSIQRSGLMTDHILANCWEETIDPGIYTPSESGKIPWGKVLVGDRTYVLMQIRIAGRGDSLYQFKAQCDGPQCRKQFDWEIDLDDLPVQMLASNVREQLKAGNLELECIVPGTEEQKLLAEDAQGIILARPKREIIPGTGKKALFRLQTGEDEAALLKLSRSKKKTGSAGDEKEENPIADIVRLRTVSVEGAADLDAFISDMSLDAVGRLLDRYDEQDCGVEIGVEIECPNCQELQEKLLPFGADFFFQRKKARR